MAHKALVQQITEQFLGAAAEVGPQTVGKQKGGTGGNGTGKYRIRCGLAQTDRCHLRLRDGVLLQFPAPVGVGRVIDARIMQVTHQRLAALMQLLLQGQEFFFGHNTITVVVVALLRGKGTNNLKLLQRVLLRMLTVLLFSPFLPGT